MTQRRSRARDLNAPEHWLAWLRGCQKDDTGPCQVRGLSLGAITGTDARVLRAIAALWSLCVTSSQPSSDPLHLAALAGIRALLPQMQRQCWPFARELAAQQLNWEDRDRLWPLVEPRNDAGPSETELAGRLLWRTIGFLTDRSDGSLFRDVMTWLQRNGSLPPSR